MCAKQAARHSMTQQTNTLQTNTQQTRQGNENDLAVADLARRFTSVSGKAYTVLDDEATWSHQGLAMPGPLLPITPYLPRRDRKNSTCLAERDKRSYPHTITIPDTSPSCKSLPLAMPGRYSAIFHLAPRHEQLIKPMRQTLQRDQNTSGKNFGQGNRCVICFSENVCPAR